MEASPETTAIPIHIHRIRDFFHALLSRPVVDEIASGRLEMKTAARYAAPTAPSLEDRESDHHRLRNTVQHRPEHDGQRRAALLISVGILAITSAEARNQPVAAEEHAAPDEEAPGDRAVAGRLLGCLLDQVERDRADQHPPPRRP
jgi:hypothetical protein